MTNGVPLGRQACYRGRVADSPQKPFEVRQRLLERAGRLLGRSTLAAGLKVTESQLDDWIDGRAAIPDAKLGSLASLLSKFAQDKRP